MAANGLSARKQQSNGKRGIPLTKRKIAVRQWSIAPANRKSRRGNRRSCRPKEKSRHGNRGSRRPKEKLRRGNQFSRQLKEKLRHGNRRIAPA
jgi:hypothetical protein